MRYSTLPAGKYEFEVKYTPSIDSDNEQVISIAVKVTPYFWKSWWFITLMVILIIALAQYAYIRKLFDDFHTGENVIVFPIADTLLRYVKC